MVSKFGGTRIATEIILFFLNLSPNCHKNFSVKNIMFDTVFQCQILKIEKKKKGFLSILCATEKFWVACAAHLLAAHVVCHVVLKACGQTVCPTHTVRGGLPGCSAIPPRFRCHLIAHPAMLSIPCRSSAPLARTTARPPPPPKLSLNSIRCEFCHRKA